MKKKGGSAADAPRDSRVFGDFSEQNRVGRTLTTVFVVVGVIIMLVIFTVIVLRMFFSVDTIIIDGVDHYSYEKLLEIAGVSKGETIFGFSEDKISDRLVSALPYVRSVKVELEFPSTVKMTVEEEVPAYAFEMDGEFFLISSEMKVLDRYQSQKALTDENPDIMLVKIPTVGRAISGDILVFRSEFDSKHTDDVLAALVEWERYDRITDIDLSNRFDLTLVYEDRFVLKFGTYVDFSDKLALAEKMIDYYSDTASGTLILSDVDKGIAQIDDEGEDSEDSVDVKDVEDG